MMRRFAALLGLWLLCAHALAAVPERPRFRIVGAAQGLPSTEIKALARDHHGYLWIATADGLARYDGVGMRVWRYDPATGQVALVPVTIGQYREEGVVVTSGVAHGDWIVAAGVNKLVPGQVVRPYDAGPASAVLPPPPRGRSGGAPAPDLASRG